MSQSASRLPREDHPPLSRALRTVLTVTGTSGVELARLLGRSQSSIARYYSDREPDYPMAVEIERALGLPGGTLAALAGYVPSTWESNALAAIADDDSLTPAQKENLVYIIIESLRAQGNYTMPADAMVAVNNDPKLTSSRRRMLAHLIGGYREENAVAKASRRRARR